MGTLDAAPWTDIVREFKERRVDAIRDYIEESPLGALSLSAYVDRLLTAEEAMSAEDADREMTARFAATRDEDEFLLTAIYVLLAAREKWQSSTAWPIIQEFLKVSRDAGRAALGSRRLTPDTERVLAVALDYARIIHDCTMVENALNSSSATSMRTHAAEVVAGAESALATLTPVGARYRGPVSLLTNMAETDRTFYSAVAAAADAVDSVNRGHPDSGMRLQGAIEHLSRAEAMLVNPDPDVYRLELRAHRLVLDELVAAMEQDWLFIDRCRLTYCYPFTFDLSIDTRAALAELIESAPAGLSEEGPLGAGIEARPLLLTDMWGNTPGSDSFNGITLQLPDLTIRTADGGEMPAKPEARLLNLGNHYLRIKVTPQPGVIRMHELNQLLRRPMEVMGYETIHDGGPIEYRQLAQYADATIDAVRQALRPVMDRHSTRASRRRSLITPWRQPPAADAFDDWPPPSKDAHVVLSVRELSTGLPTGTERTAALGEAVLDRRIKGTAALREPVRQPAAALEEWVRYRDDADDALVLQTPFRGDNVLRTANSTVLAMPSTPDFLVQSYEEAAEFVATLPAFLRNRGLEVSRLVAAQPRTESADVTSLYETQKRLKSRIAQVRLELAALHSSAVTRTVMGRRMLDRFYEASELQRREEDLDSQLRHADASYDENVVAYERVARRTIGAFVIAISLSAISELIMLWDEQQGPWKVAAVLAIAVVVAVLAYRKGSG